MRSFLSRRLLSTLPVLLGIVVGSFLFMRLAPGGPFDTERALPPAVQANLEARYGLHQPLTTQLARYVGGLLHGDLGPSYKYLGWSVREILSQAFPVSLTLGALALLIALGTGIPLGLAAAMHHNRWPDRVAMGAALLGLCVPSFVLGPLLIIAFVFQLKLLPVGGFGTFSQLILPAVTLGALRAAAIARLTRAGALEVVGQDFVRTARAKGLSVRTVMLKHVLRPAILPVVSYLGPATASILVGSVVVEQVFSVPGLGSFLVNAALNRDYTLAMGAVLLYSGLLIALNLVVDVLYSALDPRVELS